MIYKKINNEGLQNKVGNVFILVNLASKRVRELASGAPKLLETKNNDPIHVALEEIAEGKVVAGEKGDKEQENILQEQQEASKEEGKKKTTEGESPKEDKTEEKEAKEKDIEKQGKKKKKKKKEKKKE